MQTLTPSSLQGKAEDELFLEVMKESDRRTKLYYERIEALYGANKDGQKLIENPIEPLISQETTNKLEKIYMKTDIYRKTGKLPPEPKLIDDGEIEKLRLTDTKKIVAGETEENKELDKKDKFEEKKKVAGQT